MAKFRVDVDGKKVSRDIEKRINAGIDNAANEINDEMRSVAKDKIRAEKAVWRGELLEGFVNSKVEFGGNTVASIRNRADHAPYQEKGVSGTENPRNTPFQYTDKKPPLDSLLPWIRDNLNGFWPSDLGDPPNDYTNPDSGVGNFSSINTSLSGNTPSGSGGSDVTDTITGVPLDENRLYAGEPGYIVQDMNDVFDNRDLFPGANVVVYNSGDKEYERATILEFPGQDDDRIKVVLDSTAGIYTVRDHNQSKFRLVGYEDFDELPEQDIQQRLRDHFDSNIRGRETEILKKYPSMDFVKPDPDRMDWLRDKWTTDIWDLYRDKWYVKEQIRNLDAVVDYEDSKVKQGYLGGIGPYNDPSIQFMGIFLSQAKLQLRNDQQSEAEYLDTLKHEAEHAFSTTNKFGYVGRKSRANHIAKWAVFGRDGEEQTKLTKSPDTGKSIQIPETAIRQMFFDKVQPGNEPVGGSDWMGDAYDAAKNGDIEAYSPTFDNGLDKPLSRLHEAANKAYWLQLIHATENAEPNAGKMVPKKDLALVQRRYSLTNAEETLATFHEIMSSTVKDYEIRIRRMFELYPWLIEAWLQIHNPPENVAGILRDLGYNV